MINVFNNLPMLLETGTEEVPTLSTELGGVVTSLTDALSRSDLIAIITVCIGASVGFALLWFGIRKVKNAVQDGAFKGKIKI